MLRLSELGNRLKQAREEKNISLDDLQAVTKIQKRYLLGIEEGNYSMMPGKFYVRAFIKQYAEAVDLDPEELFEEYKSEVPATHKDDVPEQLSRVKTQKEMPKTASKFLELLPKILIFLVILVVAVGLWIWRQSGSDQPQEQNSANETNNSEFESVENLTSDESENVQENEEETTDPEPEPEPEKPKQEISFKEANGSNATYELLNAETFQLEILANERAWVRVKNGKGKTFFEGEIPQGETLKNDFSEESEIIVRVGYIPGTDLKINGELLEYENEKKTTQNITILFTKE